MSKLYEISPAVRPDGHPGRGWLAVTASGLPVVAHRLLS